MSLRALDRRVTPLPVSVRRKCASCGEVTGTCTRCSEGHARAPDDEHAPLIVHEVVSSSGRPLEPSTRGAMEQGFQRDFSAVLVHCDASAARSAEAVRAQAYAVGQHIVFGTGRYDPSGAAGRRLLAHELSHTLQQPRDASIPASLPIGAAHGAPEREADMMADAALSGQAPAPAHSLASGVHRLQRAGMGELRVSEGIYESKVAEEATRKSEAEVRAKNEGGGAPNMAGRILTDADIAKAQAASGAASPGRIVPVQWKTNFVLHDTASNIGAKKIAEHAAHGRRSSGEGAGAFVPQAGDATITHQPLFGPRRPAATQHERGEDVMPKASREAAYRAVWQATKADVREKYLDAMLVAQGSPAKEAKSERATAIKELDASSGMVHSAGAWAVEDICGAVSPATAPAMATTPADAATLEAKCAALRPLLGIRAARIGSAFNVEIVKEGGSDCRTKEPLTPLSAYTPSQMENVKKLYLNAALQALAFPAITTHFQIDKAAGDHCDPRCFNLTALYRDIQSALGHPTGCTYGIAPAYGTGSGDNVWWHGKVCGGAHP
jgi:hypothetical protein